MTEPIETNRYARRTVTVKGLAAGTLPDDAKLKVSEYGLMWDLTGNPKNLHTQTVTKTTTFIEGEELPSGLTTNEINWVLALAEKHGLEMATTDEEVVCHPVVPYINAPLLIHNPDKDLWERVISFDGFEGDAKAHLERCSGTLRLLIEGSQATDVSNLIVDKWIQSTVKLVRDALRHAGFEENDLEIDCEVIMGAEREAKCSPLFMRALLTDQESEEQ
tara:strand:+ start:3016 stop:3672 length:657 start_codon:yes stop_codon:yes gene_type:complete